MEEVRKLIIDRGIVRKMVGEAEASLNEVCGFLLGKIEGEVVKVLDLHLSENIAPSPARFEIKPEDIYRAHMKAEEAGLSIVSIYHSHPAPPHPSIADLEGMERWPIPWLIISSIEGSVDAYLLKDGRLTKLDVDVVLDMMP